LPKAVGYFCDMDSTLLPGMWATYMEMHKCGREASLEMLMASLIFL